MTQPIAPHGRTTRALIAHRLVQAGLILALLWKWQFFLAASRVYEAIPLDDPFFPFWLQSVWTLRVAFVSCLIAIALNFVVTNSWVQRACSWITWIGISVLCVHQASHNDMTFTTAWWTSLWSVWYVHHLGDTDENAMLRRAAFLSRAIISVILLGGAVGKWTAEYWSGEVFYDIYFRDRDFWVFNLLRARFEPETLREIATWYSRNVIVVETVAGLGLWMLPPKWAALTGVVLLTSIALFSNFLLFSVLACLIALSAVGFFVASKD